VEFGPSAGSVFARRHHHRHHTGVNQNENNSRLSNKNADQVSMGTTLVAIRYDGGVVVAADSRTSVSSYVSNRFSRKIDQVSPRCVLLRSGSAADTQQLASDCFQFVRYRSYRYGGGGAAGAELSVSQIAHWLRRQVREESKELVVGLIIAGYDCQEKRGKIFSLFSSGTIHEEPRFAVSGSGSSFIIGYLDEQISRLGEALPSLDLAITLCEQAIKGAIHRDSSSGGIVRICMISEDGVKERNILPSFTRD